MKGVKKFSAYLKEELQNKEFRKAFVKEEIYANLAIQIAQMRRTQGHSQKEIAEFLGTTQQTISRLENPRNSQLSLNTLVKLASFFKKGLQIQFV